jgi:hypothetical protein
MTFILVTWNELANYESRHKRDVTVKRIDYVYSVSHIRRSSYCCDYYRSHYQSIMKDNYRDIYFLIIVGLVSFAVILATGIYIELLPYL